jgi:hypothetical protein
MSKLISIVTINLGDDGGLRRTAASIAAQTYRSFEWLVLDAGPSTGSLRVLKQCAPLVDGWWGAPMRGAYDAMNRGLARASGDYVLFKSAGDRLACETILERLADALCRRPCPDLLFGGAVLELQGNRSLYRPPRSPESFLRFGLPSCHQAILFRRTVHLEAL